MGPEARAVAATDDYFIIAHICAAHSFPDFDLLFTWVQCWAVIIHRLRNIHSFYDRNGTTLGIQCVEKQDEWFRRQLCCVGWRVWVCVLVGDRNRLDIRAQPCFPSKFVVEHYSFFSPFSTRDSVICALCDTNECGAHTKQTHTTSTFTGSNGLLASFIEMVLARIYLYFLGYECDSRNSQNVRQSYCIFCSDDAIVYGILRSQSIPSDACCRYIVWIAPIKCLLIKCGTKAIKKHTTTEYSERVIIP